MSIIIIRPCLKGNKSASISHVTFDFPDEVLDLTTPALPLVNMEEEELFPDFSVLGSFNFSAPSASLILKRDHVW